MLLLDIGIGAVGAFVLMALASSVYVYVVVHVDQRLEETEPIPRLGPSLLNGLEFSAKDDTSAKALRGIERGLADHDRYKQALESIGTLRHESTAQAIARQALGKGWTA